MAVCSAMDVHTTWLWPPSFSFASTQTKATLSPLAYGHRSSSSLRTSPTCLRKGILRDLELHETFMTFVKSLSVESHLFEWYHRVHIDLCIIDVKGNRDRLVPIEFFRPSNLFELPMDGDGVVDDSITDLPRGKWYGDWDENTWILTLDTIEGWRWSEESTENGRERSYNNEVIDACFLLWRHHGCSPRVFFLYSSSMLQIDLFFLSFSHTLIMNSMSDCRPDKNSHHQPSPDVSELDQARREFVSIQKPEFLPPSEQKMIEMIRL